MSRKFQLKLLCLMVAGAWVQSAFAGPAGPVVNAGKASYDPATLTLTASSVRTQIGWKSFNVGAGEVVNFVLPSAQSAVLNQIFDPQSLNTLGGFKSNGHVLFMSNGMVYGTGATLDVAGMISTSLRLPKLALAPRHAGDQALSKSLATLAEGRVYVVGEDAQAVTSIDGEVFLAPGTSVELVGAAIPNLRVELTAPQAEAINLTRLIGSKRETGIFAGLFRVPASARKAVQRDVDSVMTASSSDAQMSEQERFYRYLAMYARMRTESARQEGGMVKVALAPGARTLLPALKSRPSLLPQDIEIGAPRPQELALRAATLPLETEEAPALAYAAVEPPALAVAMPLERPIMIASARAVHSEEVSLSFASAEPPAEAVAQRIAQPVMVAAVSEVRAVEAPVLSFVAAEPPAETVATRIEQPVMIAALSQVRAVEAPVLSFVAAEPPAETVATRIEQPLMVAAVSQVRVEEAPLDYAAAEPPAVMIATRIAEPVTVAAVTTGQSDQAPMLSVASAEAPAEAVAQRIVDPVMVAAVGQAQVEAPQLGYAAVEPPAAAVATRIAAPAMVAEASARTTDDLAPSLNFPAVEIPASAVARPAAQLVMVAAASTGRPEDLPLLDLAPVAAQARPEQPPLVQAEAQHLPKHALSRTAPEVVIVALAQHTEGAAPEEVHKVKEIRIERRIPRYFTDYRGAMFFM